MSRVVAYTQGGQEQSLAYWRRIYLPYNQLVQQHLFQSFTQVAIDGEMNDSMLHAAEVVLLQNYVPQTNTERVAFTQAARSLDLFWIYDLTEARLLEHASVQEILPLMSCVSVPNEYLLKEVRYFLRRGQSSVLVLPSTLSQGWLVSSLPQDQPRRFPGIFRLGMFGDHDWCRFIPAFFEALSLVHEHIAVFWIFTDQEGVARTAQEWEIPAQKVSLVASTYGALLSSCDVGLLPREGQCGRETAWANEYALLMCPTIAASGSSYSDTIVSRVLPYHDPAAWVREMCSWITTDAGTAWYTAASREGYMRAMGHRVSVCAMLYRLRLRASLPSLPRLS